MKTIILTIIMFFLFTVCKKEEIQLDASSIYGSWQLVEVYDGDLSGYYPVENGRIYTFSKDNGYSIADNRFNIRCGDGTYKINKDTIEFIDKCEHISSKYIYTLENSKLKLTPTFYIGCPEGCHDIYKKIADE